MRLVSMKEILINARKNKYAVGGFEIWNMESVQAVISISEQLNQPVILQIGPMKSITQVIGSGRRNSLTLRGI